MLSAYKMTLMRSHCLSLFTCMMFKSLLNVINDILFNKMHGLSVYPLLETIIQLLKSQQDRNLTLY